jgi:hypothetical protein
MKNTIKATNTSAQSTPTMIGTEDFPPAELVVVVAELEQESVGPAHVLPQQ